MQSLVSFLDDDQMKRAKRNNKGFPAPSDRTEDLNTGQNFNDVTSGATAAPINESTDLESKVKSVFASVKDMIFKKVTNEPWSESFDEPGICAAISIELIKVLKEQIKGHKFYLHSIDIKPKWYAVLDDGQTNKDHTAIRSGDCIIDGTAGQFDRKYGDKIFWVKDEWENEFEK